MRGELGLYLVGMGLVILCLFLLAIALKVKRRKNLEGESEGLDGFMDDKGLKIESGFSHNSPPPLPPRRKMRQGTRNGHKDEINRNLGPRGLRPAQFPCCPIDRQRNRPGQPQRIFWDGKRNCYVCSNNHHFRSNGTLC